MAAREPADPERAVRLDCRDIFRETRLLKRIIPTIEEVVEPAPVSLVPHTLGAWLTLAALAGVLLFLAGWCVWRWRKRRHRRAAAAELGALQRAWAADRSALGPLEAVPVEHPVPAFGETGREVDRGGGLAHAALLVGERYDIACHGIT